MLPPVTNNSTRTPRTHPFEQPYTKLNFARQALLQPLATGAIAPSSQQVARAVIELANLKGDQSEAKTVVELGPGTGVFTQHILNTLSDDSTFFAMELNPAFVDATRTRCPQARVYQDSALHLQKYLRANKRDYCDCIVSSLPWTIFEPAEQDAILEQISSVLRPGGTFVSIVYLGGSLRSRGRYFINSLPLHFQTVNKSKTVWRNLPPTVVYHCQI